MAVLLGDVGGTNARLALAHGDEIDVASIARYQGDDFASFDDVVQLFLRERGAPRIDAACIAAAGPVAGGRAELTNRDWDMTEDGIADLTGAAQVRLINDLTALGYATPALPSDGLRLLRAAPSNRISNGQRLVVGLGTGFNVCVTRQLPDGRTLALEAEEGHAQLPANIYRKLLDLVGHKGIAPFISVEETFAGRGLSRFHAALTHQPQIRGEAIAAAALRGEAQALATYEIFAELVGLMCRELTMHYMPLDGLFLAGSVGRSIAELVGPFEKAFLAEPYMRHIPENTPVFLITDDMAALHGCLAALR